MFSKNLFSERLLALRTSQAISREALADELGVSYYAIAKMENAERACSIEVLYKLAAFFNVSADYLLGLSDIPERR